MIDANGQSLAYFYARENDNDTGTAGVLTMDEARGWRATSPSCQRYSVKKAETERGLTMEQFNEIAPTVDRREMGMGRAVFLMIATLLLWCGSMLLVLDLAANASGTHGQVALIGLVLVAIGGSCLWADFFEVTSWFARNVG